ncbi:MAG: cysteine dioxygenase family protein [Lacunisphaera sp.]|nr:cysteine dioxygenase family protein [Lacunisphaera sp.]
MSSSSHPVPAKLQPLVNYLNGLTQRATIDRLQELLAASHATIDDVKEFVRFEPTTYQRNLVALGPWYEILVICWRSGQRSPIHNHAQSTCGLKVLQGVCTETYFAHSPCGQVVALSSHECEAGHICASEDEDTHQVSNLQSPGHDLVTIHIYSPPLRAMKKFSITGGESDWRPPVFEFAHGEGI